MTLSLLRVLLMCELTDYLLHFVGHAGVHSVKLVLLACFEPLFDFFELLALRPLSVDDL